MQRTEKRKLNIIELETPQNTEKFCAPKTNQVSPFWLTEYGTTFKGIPCYQIRINSLVSCLQYVISGSGIIINNDNIFTVSAGDTFLLQAGTDQIYYSNPDNQFERIWVNFHGTLAEKILESYGINECVVYHNTDTNELLKELHCICKTNTNPINYQNETSQFFLKIAQFLSAHKANASIKTETKEDIRLYLDRHIMENLKLSSIAENFHISKEHLIRKFRKEYNITPHQYILQSKIRIAMIMLQTSQNSIESISNQLNFSDPHHFILQFKKNSGFTPSEYRKKFKKSF